MPKKQRKVQEEEDDEVQDVMAWGNKKQNYYQQAEEEYSQSDQQQQQAEELYQRQIEQWGQDNVYKLPSDQRQMQGQEEQQDGQEQQVSQLSHQYLTKEIARIAKLGIKISEESESKVRRILQTQIQAYLMTLIGLRDLNIPYIQFHPLFNKAIEMKQDIAKLQRLLSASTVQDEKSQSEDFYQKNYDEEMSEDEQSQEQQYQEIDDRKNKRRDNVPNVEEGLKIYQEAKRQHLIAKSNMKEQRRKEIEKNKKPAFLVVKGNQGRLASQRILKNKGLLKKRKKIDRNSRVKHKRKYEKAQILMRSKGKIIRQNPGIHYQGQRNIRQGRNAAVKLHR